MDDFKKASLTVIKDVSVQLILIAVGVFSLAGSFLASQKHPVTWRACLVAAFSALIFSVLAGLLALGNAVAQLGRSQFEPYHGVLRWSYALQLVLVLAGGTLFAMFLLANIQ
jgi:hypothetical protein